MAKNDEKTTDETTVAPEPQRDDTTTEVEGTNDPNNLVAEPANDHVLGEGDDAKFDPFESGRSDALKNAADENQNA